MTSNSFDVDAVLIFDNCDEPWELWFEKDRIGVDTPWKGKNGKDSAVFYSTKTANAAIKDHIS